MLKLATAFVEHYDLYLLDEPTTHLDDVSVELLKAMLQDFGGTMFFTSHDRYFNERAARRHIAL